MEKYGLNIIWTARYDYHKGQMLASHKHDFYQILIGEQRILHCISTMLIQ